MVPAIKEIIEAHPKVKEYLENDVVMKSEDFESLIISTIQQIPLWVLKDFQRNKYRYIDGKRI